MQSGMPSNHLRGHQPEVLHRDIDFTGYPLTYNEAPRPIGAAIFAASPEIEFFNRIGQMRMFGEFDNLKCTESIDTRRRQP